MRAVLLPVLIGLVLWAFLAGADAAPQGFEHYRVILDRKPFGEILAPEPVIKPISPNESFARTLRLSALLEIDDGDLRVGIVDLQTKDNFFLSVGEIVEGIELVSASYDDEEAVLRKGSEMAVIKLQSGDIQPLNAAQQQARLEKSKTRRRPSYAERRRAREERRRQPPPEPKYKGEELERHLQEYQMEVIRQGLPPLPIPLTPEMDNQLVTEGVLPPME